MSAELADQTRQFDLFPTIQSQKNIDRTEKLKNCDLDEPDLLDQAKKMDEATAVHNVIDGTKVPMHRQDQAVLLGCS